MNRHETMLANGWTHEIGASYSMDVNKFLDRFHPSVYDPRDNRDPLVVLTKEPAIPVQLTGKTILERAFNPRPLLNRALKGIMEIEREIRW